MSKLAALNIDAFRLDHLGIPAQMAERIGLVSAIDNLAGTDCREILSTGQAVLAMTLNCLGFTSRPLYISPQFFLPRNVKFLLGCSANFPELELQPDHLNEHRLGRALDRIAEIGPDRVFLEVAIKAFRAESVSVPMVHEDTTTHSFYGSYENSDGSPRVGIVGTEGEEPVEVVVTHGYSKDYRVECKQVVQELLVSPDGDVPLMFKAWSGNTSDVIIMRERIRKLKSALKKANAEDLMPEYFIGDSKLYAKNTLEEASRDGTYWITRVPDTVSRVHECISAALKGKKYWVRADHISKGLSWQSFVIVEFGIEQRFVVVRTDASVARKEAAIERRIAKERDLLEAGVKRLKKTRFACIPDLEKAWLELFAKAHFHIPSGYSAKRFPIQRGRGRPRKGENGEAHFSLETAKISKDLELIRKAKLEGACFVIATNDLREPIRSENVLRYYLKQQQGVERGFRFLKDPHYFADAFFLKNPARISALLCIMTMALLLFSLAQRRLRLELVEKRLEVADQRKKKTQKPTMRWVSQHFEGVDVTRVRSNGEVLHRFHRLGDFESTVLRALGSDYEKRYSETAIG
jgi:transposase